MSEILVVGGAGYIGSHVIIELLENNQKVVILDDLSTGSKEAVLGGVFYHGCMSDESLLDKIFRQHNISSVMLLAGCIEVNESVTNPSKYYINNISNTLVLLDSMVRNKILKLIFSSTASICGTEKNVITLQSDASPQNPYARTKYMVEQILSDYDKAYGLKSIIFRYFNAAGADPQGRIGFHEPTTHLIPLALKTASGRKKHLDIYGDNYPTRDGTCIRDYIHVMDLASAHLLALKYLIKNSISQMFNLGNEKGHSVQEVISVTKKITNIDFKTQTKSRREGDPFRMVADCTYAKDILGWLPQYGTLDEIIQHSWQWEQNKSQYI